MPVSTDEIVEEFLEAGVPIESAREWALEYIEDQKWEGVANYYAENKQDDIQEYFISAAEEESISKYFEIGAPFKGVKEINEYEDNDIFVPSSYYCAIKCYEKYFNIEISKQGLSPHGNTTSAIKKKVSLALKAEGKNRTWENDAPKMIRYDHKTKQFKPLNTHHKTMANMVCALIRIERCNYHAILFKYDNYNKFTHKQIVSRITTSENKTISNDQTKIMPLNIKKPIRYIFGYDIETYSSHVIKQNKKGENYNAKVLIPMAVSYHMIDLELNIHYPVYFFVGEKCLHSMINSIVDNCKIDNKDLILEEYILFAHNGGKFDHLYFKGVDLIKFESCFESAGRIKSLSGTINRYLTKQNEKMIDINIPIKIKFLDSLAFTQASLETSCIMMKTMHKKLTFDIIDKPKEFYLNRELFPANTIVDKYDSFCFKIEEKDWKEEKINKPNNEIYAQNLYVEKLRKSKAKNKEEQKMKKQLLKDNIKILEDMKNEFKPIPNWIDYLLYDVLSLSDVIENFNKILNTFGVCIANFTGISGVAYHVMLNTCIYMKQQFIIKCPITKRFVRESCYGGRLLHWKKYFNNQNILLQNIKGLICLDGNSLYPSAMKIGLYPIGKSRIIDNLTLENIYRMLDINMPFIIECTLDGNNCRFPLIPYRTEGNNLIYPAGQFTGIYNSVEIKEALNLGYTLKSAVRGIYWVEAQKIFENLITNMYEARKVYKAQDNPLEYTFKILYNSMYGKLLEIIDSATSFSPDKETKPKMEVSRQVHLTNGQYETRYVLDQSIERKPTHIASFILSYARVIMNRLIIKVGCENVYYGDTDSIYVTENSLANIPKEWLNDDLCGFKNDYEDKIINEAYFLDVKRYYVEFSRDEFCVDEKAKIYKAKFNGINFKDSKSLTNWRRGDDNTDGMKEFYESFIKPVFDEKGQILHSPEEIAKKFPIINDKWIRTKTSVEICEKEMQFCINPNKRANWEGNDFIPIGYNKNLQPRLYKDYQCQLESIEKIKSKQFLNTGKGLISALPIYIHESEIKKAEKSGKKKIVRNQEGKQIEEKEWKMASKNCPSDFEFSYIFVNNEMLYTKTDFKVYYDEEGEKVFVPLKRYFRVCEYGPKEEVEAPKSFDFVLIAKKSFGELTSPAPSIDYATLQQIQLLLIKNIQNNEMKKQKITQEDEINENDIPTENEIPVEDEINEDEIPAEDEINENDIPTEDEINEDEIPTEDENVILTEDEKN